MMQTETGSGVILWPHQTAAIDATWVAITTGLKAGLILLPTGCGKTFTFLTLARRLRWPTLVLVHRDELTRQTVAATAKVWPEARTGVIQAKQDDWRGGQDLVVASVQSLHARRREVMPPDRFGLVIVDEAHHAVASTYSDVIAHFSTRQFLLGVTATADRLDGKGLAKHFGDKPLFSYSLRKAIKDGRLVRIRQLAIETTTDLSKVKTRMGDFAEADLADAIDTPERNQTVVAAFLEHAADRKAIAFCAGLEHVANLAKAFSAAGIRTASVSGRMPTEERRQTLADFAAGRYQVLVNCQVLTEGFDERSVGCVLMARPTASRALYTQCVGRGFRLCPETGKTDCVVLDFVDNCRRHKLVNVLDLLGAKHVQDAGGGDALEAVEEEEREHDALRQHRRERPLVWSAEEVSPWPEVPSLAGYVPTQPWHSDPASDKQLACLKRFGLATTRALSKGEASCLLDRCHRYEAEFPTPATAKQRYFLSQAGQWRPGLSKREASELIGHLKAQEPCPV